LSRKERWEEVAWKPEKMKDNASGMSSSCKNINASMISANTQKLIVKPLKLSKYH